MDKVNKDPRFAHIAKDPKFRRMKVNQRKVQIDKRFEGMFKDKSFKLKYSVDKRGRPVQQSTTEDLRKYYALDDSDDEVKDQKKKKGKDKDDKALEKPKKETTMKPVIEDDRFNQPFSSDDEDDDTEEKKDQEEEEKEAKSGEEDEEEEEKDEEDEEDEEEDEEDEESDDEEPSTGTLPGKMPDIARGEGLDSSSSEDDDDEEDEEDAEEEDEHRWGELDHDAPQIADATRRFALCNMDWDRIKAHDLFMLFNSFKPADGVLKSVHIYPSEFGLERMKEEDRLGPSELRKNAPESAPVEDDKDDNRSADAKEETEKLRKYQLNRLKYYYAVVECDSAKTANHIYEECDGREYESSAIHLDLRFIPDDMIFDQKPKSVATGVTDASAYKPNLFISTALQQSKVQCTWDETDKDRLAVTMKKYSKDELETLDLKDYLASSSDEDAEDIYAGFIEQPDFGKTQEEDEDKRLEAYKEMMQIIKEKDKRKVEKDTELQITWESGLKKTTQEIVKKKKKKETETVWEQYLEKKKEKKREKVKKSKTKVENTNTVSAKDDPSDEEEEMQEEKEGISDDEIPSDVDMNDPYFKEELESAENQGKSGKKKKYKKVQEVLTPEEEAKKKKEEAELTMLMMDEDDDKEHFSLKAIMDSEKMSGKKKKKRSQKQMMRQAMKAGKKNVQDSFKINLEDARFSAVFDTADYNIDPSAPEFKATKNMDSLIQEKFKRKSKKQDRSRGDEEKSGKEAKRPKLENEDKSVKAKDNSLAKLVSSVKMKTKSHQIKKKS